MLSNRSEYFRFEFEQPIDATFRIIEVNGVEKISKLANAKIVNLSPHGIRLITSLNFELEYSNRIKLEITFSLDNNNPIVVNGVFVWQKKEIKDYSYGINIISTEESEKKIIEELKKFSKQTVYIKRKK